MLIVRGVHIGEVQIAYFASGGVRVGLHYFNVALETAQNRRGQPNRTANPPERIAIAAAKPPIPCRGPCRIP